MDGYKALQDELTGGSVQPDAYLPTNTARTLPTVSAVQAGRFTTRSRKASDANLDPERVTLDLMAEVFYAAHRGDSQTRKLAFTMTPDAVHEVRDALEAAGYQVLSGFDASWRYRVPRDVANRHPKAGEATFQVRWTEAPEEVKGMDALTGIVIKLIRQSKRGRFQVAQTNTSPHVDRTLKIADILRRIGFTVKVNRSCLPRSADKEYPAMDYEEGDVECTVIWNRVNRTVHINQLYTI